MGWSKTYGIVHSVLREWTVFDGWCAARNIDPLSLSSRRFVALAVYYLQEGLDSEGLEKFRHELDRLEAIPHPLTPTPKPKVELSATGEPVKLGRWKPPPGWTPPGWKDDSTNYQNIQGFLKFQQEVKK